MSFICKVCGSVANGEKQIKIPVKIRDVEYNLQSKTVYADGESLKTVRKTHGTEIVEEVSYCKKCSPNNITSEKIGKVTRNQIIKPRSIKKNNEDVDKTEEETTKRNHRSKDKEEE